MEIRRIAALVPNVLNAAPGQRVRIESWAKYLPQFGWSVDFYPFEDEPLHEIFYRPGRAAAKAARLLSCFARQLRRVLEGPPCDVLFIYREAALIGPALLERLAKRVGAPVVYDLDDPVFIPYRSPVNGWMSLLKFPRKTHALFRLSDRVIAINRLIADYAAGYNPAVSVIPNFIDTEVYRPAPDTSRNGAVRIGWTGSVSTMQNLKGVAAPLARVQAERRAPFCIIGVGQAELPGVEFEVRQWSPQTEVSDLQSCDIGIVPVLDLPWNRWKFFLKTVQYMAVGLPVVATRMGSNSEIIEDGVNGFLADTPEEWYDRLRLLAGDAELRRRMGAAARRTAVERFSLQSQMPRVAEVFERALGARGAERAARVGEEGRDGRAPGVAA